MVKIAADVLADMLGEKISLMGDVQVVTEMDIKSMLSLEKRKRLMVSAPEVSMSSGWSRAWTW